MKKEEQFLLWFEQLERKDVDIVGGKSSSLGEMTAKTDVPVPYGFATTAYAYRYFIKESGLEEKMRSILSELTDVENSALLRDVSARLRDAIMAEKMPQDLQDAIGAAYVELGKRVGEENPYVAVRSSATAEDLPDASFAGQQDTYLNVQGAETIIAKVKECYASCFTDRAVYYREKQGFDHIEVALSAVVQMMVFSKTSGVMFTVNVATGDDNNILIEAAFGLGEYVVQGTVTPDNYTISKHDHKIIDRCVNEQDIMLVRKKGGDCEEVQVPEELRKVQTLTDEQILELADYAKKIEKHYGCYMDMEWGVDERTNKIWILQARPETVWSRRNKEGGAKVQESKSMTTTDHKVIVKGLPASPGKVSGRVHVILDPSRIDEFKEGEILVTEMTAPDWVPAMKKAKAIVTDSGGMTCHASIVSRELGIPCIVGTKSRGEAATVTIPDGIDVTIDATHGVVYEGIIEEAKKAEGELYIACMGALTNIAVAVLHEPSIADKISIVWVGGRLNVSDDKGYEANARNDYKAVNVVMERCSKILHIPYETYTMMQVSIAELELRVKPYHEIGEYLFNQLNDFNYNINRPWTNGESWNMGDTTSISVLINKHSATYAKRNAFILDKELNVTEIDKEITAVTSIDSRYAMEDFYAKLVLFSRHQKQTLF